MSNFRKTDFLETNTPTTELISQNMRMEKKPVKEIEVNDQKHKGQ